MCGCLAWVVSSVARCLDAPFEVLRDADYYDDLKHRYAGFYEVCKDASADHASLEIISRHARGVLSSLQSYYEGKISSAYNTVERLVEECLDSPLAVATVDGSYAFPGETESEIQFFRARRGGPSAFPAREMLHLPYSMRGKTGNYRFSIPGVPTLYLGNSSYDCWIELGRPADYEFNVSPVLLDCTQKVFNLAVMNRDFHALREFDPEWVHTWLKLIILMVATSYRIRETDRTFKSEYIISQNIMLACQELGLDGIVYYSKRVVNQLFAQAAINLALFTKYVSGREYGDACRHIKVGDSFNYFIFRQLDIPDDEGYPLRCVGTGAINNIGNFERQYSYTSTNFCLFDQFLFAGWDKNVSWGNALSQ